MSEESYEYECMRAELLGLPKPEKRPEVVKQVADDDDDEEDEMDTEMAKELEGNKEQYKRLGGGLEELNSILSVTQKKINSFKTNFGSLKDLFRSHLSTDNASTVENDKKVSEAAADEEATSSVGTPEMTKKVEETSKVAKDLGEEMESQVDKLDSLVAKAEYTEMRMASQNKQMRKFVR